MRYIANILTKERFDNIEYFNIVNDTNKIIESLPTLIIGWELAKSLFSDASILDWQINDKWYWTFGRKVRRNRYETDIFRFKKMIFENIIKNISYEFMDVLTMTKDEKQSFFNYIKDETKKNVIIKNDMVFILYENKNKVYGVSLRDIDYKGDDRKKFLKTLYKNKNINVITEKIDIPYETRNIIMNNQYILPYLYN